MAESNSSSKRGPILIGLVFLLAPMLMLGFTAMLMIRSAHEKQGCDPAGSAVSPGQLPAEVAGYRGEQIRNAAEIMRAAKDLGLSARDQQIGVMTAMGESALRVLDHGDVAGPDSRGLFQQRDSWGPLVDRLDPYKSATMFFKAMTAKVPLPGRNTTEPTLVAHKTQVNADPYHYARWWEPAGKVVQAIAAASTGHAKANTASVAYIGDSVALRVQPQLRPQVKSLLVDAEVGRQAPAVFSAIASKLASIRSADAVVIGTGNNGFIDQAALTSTIKSLAGKPIVLIQPRVNMPWQSSVRSTISAVANLPGVTVVDWYAAAQNHPDYFDDSVHPNTTGAKALADMIAAAIGTTPSGSATGPSRYNLPNVKAHTLAVANEVGAKFNIKTVYGWRAPSAGQRDPNGHPAGLALDFMTPDSGGKPTGDQVAAYLQTNAARLSVRYIIWQQAIWSPDRASEGWRPMEDRGSPTQNHMDHVHVSLNATPGDSTTDGVSNGPVGDCAPGGESSGPLSPGGWAKPAQGQLTSPFGMRLHPVLHRWYLHDGIDIAGGCNAPIYAAHDGVVTHAGHSNDPAYVNDVEIDHGGGVITFYGHMYDAGVLVHTGDNVKAGQLIARQGSAGYSQGCHVHFMVRVGGKPIDPQKYLTDAGVKL